MHALCAQCIVFREGSESALYSMYIVHIKYSKDNLSTHIDSDLTTKWELNSGNNAERDLKSKWIFFKENIC